MSDRDGYWNSEWDPEVGLEPRDEEECSNEPSAEEAIFEYEKWLCRYRYEIHRTGSGRCDSVLMSCGHWEPLRQKMCGKFQTELKWLADVLAEKYDGSVVEGEREISEEEMPECNGDGNESLEDL